MTPKLLSAEDLTEVARAVSLGGTGMGLLGHLLAHVAALEADNAALLAIAVDASSASAAAALLAQPHPGAHLRAELAKMREAWDRLCAVATSQGRSVGGVLDDAEGHRKALVRARNEGLEMAAKAITDVAGMIAVHLNADTMASTIRAMKESES